MSLDHVVANDVLQCVCYSDWVAAAESRLAVEQTAKVIKAHVALLAASLS
jgi:hypothetical protein